jgi:hypothetical protein
VPHDSADHAAYVQAWLSRAAPRAGEMPAAGLIGLFERAMAAFWRRTHTTLGEVTLAAIVDRVLYTASESYPALSTLAIVETGVSFDEFRRQQEALPSDLPQVIRFVLSEFLTVVGNLTDETLTPALHAELARVALQESENGGGDDEGAKGPRP